MSGRTRRRGALISGGLGLAGAAAKMARRGLRGPRAFRESWAFGDTSQSRRVLVAYASKCGATAQIARGIGEALAEFGCKADVVPAKEVRSIAGYDAVVLGSGVRAGKAYGAATSFARRFANELRLLPTATFSVSLAAMMGDENSRALAQGYADELGKLVGARWTTGLPGTYEPDTMAPLIRMMFSLEPVQNKLQLPPPGEYYDWDRVRSWAAALAEGLAE